MRKDIRHLFILQVKQILHHPVRLSNKLHIAILYAIVYHLHKMSGTCRPNPITTRRTIRCLCRNTLQNRLHRLPGCYRTTRHNGSTIQSPFFTTRHTGTDEKKPLRLSQCHTTIGIFIIGVTTINQDITRRK